MFLSRLAAGLVFFSGAGALKLAVVGESLVLLALGLATAAVGVIWFALGGLPAPRRPTGDPLPSLPRRAAVVAEAVRQ
jgi:hypothetical protein